MIPAKAFLVSGKGVHEDELVSFELALRDAGIEKYNLIEISSILPPGCRMISKEEGLKMLKPGEIVPCILARNQTNEPRRLVCAAIGKAVLANEEKYGYVSEHCSFGVEDRKAGKCVSCRAATMLATAHGIKFDAGAAWHEGEKMYRAEGRVIDVDHICQTAYGDEEGLWTTVVSAIVFVK